MKNIRAHYFKIEQNKYDVIFLVKILLKYHTHIIRFTYINSKSAIRTCYQTFTCHMYNYIHTYSTGFAQF